MSRPRAFSYDLLKDMYLTDPDAPTYVYAKVLTEDLRRTDPEAPQVKAGAINSVLHRYGPIWREEAGLETAPRWTSYQEIAPPAGALAPEHKMHTYMRYLRHVAREARGEVAQKGSEAKLRATALNWAARMHRSLLVVDLTPAGEPFIRSARPDEIDSKGELVSLVAWKIPGWRQQVKV